MRPRVKPALRRILRDEQTLQYGVHPLRAVMLSGLARSVRQWIEGLDGTRDLERVLDAAKAAGLDEIRARSLLDQLAAQGALHDAATSPAPLRDLTLAERDRLRPDLDALDLSSTAPEGGIGLLARRRAARVRVYGAGRVGAQIVVLLAAAGVGHIRVIDSKTTRACDITPGGLTWSEVGLTREEAAVAVARRLTSGGRAGSDTADAEGIDAAAAPETVVSPTRVPSTSARVPLPAPDTSRSQPSPRRDTTGRGGRQPAARTSQRTTASARPIRDAEVQVAGRRRSAGAGPVADQGHPETRQAAGPRHPQTGQTIDPRNPQSERTTDPRQPQARQTTTGDARLGTGQATDRGRMDTRQATDQRHPGTRQATDRGRRPDAQVSVNGEDTGARPARRRSRRIDGQALVKPAIEVVAGGTYLGDRSDRPDLVILAPVGPLDGVLVNELVCLDIPHLLASAFEGHGTVGPLVLPGETACLHCLDLTRRDHDPAWPIVTARLGGYPPGEIACDTTLATLVAAETTGHALAHLDGTEPAVTNSTMEVTPDWRWKRRSWDVHPQCRCMRNNQYSLRMVMSPHRD
ncbi:ThiF family adenylyltransferase [Nonomuraea sp. NPDC049480]|uniref:ThiF family adenylyltransferase n=1 Tax=Nonomuraea sp. NPDC049480 TaxID=3364353 RepID=UPI0037B7FEE4